MMSKPNIAQLLVASGYTHFSITPVMKAAKLLYGYIGAGLDERDWSAILSSENALQAAETAFLEMYQDTGFLLRNANYLSSQGYSANQSIYTYRQLEKEVGFSLPQSWAEGTSYASAMSSNFSSLQSAAASDYVASLPLPTLTVTATGTGFSVTASDDGVLEMVGVGNLGAVTAGLNNLAVQAAVSTGALSLSVGGRNSAETTQVFSLGTAGADVINTAAAGGQMDYVLGGGGIDTITTGAGNDWIVSGDGDDVINAGAGADTITGGAGADILTGGSGVDSYRFSVDELDEFDVITDFRNGRASEDNIAFYDLENGDLRGDGLVYQVLNIAVDDPDGAHPDLGILAFVVKLDDLENETALTAANLVDGWNPGDEFYFIAMSGIDTAIFNIKETSGDGVLDSAGQVVKLENIGIKHLSADNFLDFE